MNRNDSVEKGSYQDKSDRGPRRGGDHPRESDTRRRFEGDSKFENQGRGGRGRGGFREECEKNNGSSSKPPKCFKCQG